MSSVTKELLDFIDTAERNRKYPVGTAAGRRSALRLFEVELNDEEKESLDTFKKNLDQIYQNVFNKNKSNMIAGSLATYKMRLLSLIKDYEKYGQDPTKLANWNRPVRRYNKASSEQEPKRSNPTAKPKQEVLLPEKGSDFSRFELPLRPGIKAIIIVPSDISKSEVEKLRSYINFLDSIAGNEEGVSKNEEA